jgi:hypothetical protein
MNTFDGTVKAAHSGDSRMDFDKSTNPHKVVGVPGVYIYIYIYIYI